MAARGCACICAHYHWAPRVVLRTNAADRRRTGGSTPAMSCLRCPRYHGLFTLSQRWQKVCQTAFALGSLSNMVTVICENG